MISVGQKQSHPPTGFSYSETLYPEISLPLDTMDMVDIVYAVGAALYVK